MSKRHHATRRRAYGRRQHELHQRIDLAQVALWWDEPDAESELRPALRPDPRPALRPDVRQELQAKDRWPHLLDRD